MDILHLHQRTKKLLTMSNPFEGSSTAAAVAQQDTADEEDTEDASTLVCKLHLKDKGHAVFSIPVGGTLVDLALPWFHGFSHIRANE
jgi:hypothetical protein